MIGNRVEKSDLIGDIEGFPIEVVQKMVDEQVAQGNSADASVFQKIKAMAFHRADFDGTTPLTNNTFGR